jgi:drug/metabolite transporter (DMT)-like permease
VTRRAWMAFAAMSLIWGVPYLLIRIAVRHGVTPGALAFGRVALAAVVLLALARRAGTLRTLRGHWVALFGVAVAEIVIPFSLIPVGEQRVSSSLTAILISTVPLIVALIALRFDRSQRPTLVRAIGLVVGFGGVIALVGLDVAGKSSELLGAAAILVAAVGYAVGPTLVNLRLTQLDPRATMGASLGIASALLLPYAALDRPSAVPGVGALACVAVLGLLCTALAFVIYTVLIAEAGTGRATVITYINPIVAVTLGVALLGEQLGPGAIAGLLLILAGSWLSTDGRVPPNVERLLVSAFPPRSRRRAASEQVPGS